jgi:hypothetical protein
MMKKFLAIAIIGTISLSSLNSCDSYHSLSNAKNISQLSGNPFLQNVSKSLVRNIGSMLAQNGIKNIGKLGLNTNLSSLLSSAQAISGFKNLLSSTYGISNSIVDKNYSKLSTLRDVVGLVSTTGTKGLNFYNF